MIKKSQICELHGKKPNILFEILTLEDGKQISHSNFQDQ